MRLLRRSAALNPDLALAHGNMGQALQEEGLLSEAVVWYEQALQLEPSRPASIATWAASSRSRKTTRGRSPATAAAGLRGSIRNMPSRIIG